MSDSLLTAREVEMIYIDRVLEKQGINHPGNEDRLNWIRKSKKRYDDELKALCEENPEYMFQYGWIDQFIMESKKIDPFMEPRPIFVYDDKKRKSYIEFCKNDFYKKLHQLELDEPGYIQKYLWIDKYLKKVNQIIRQHWYNIQDSDRKRLHKFFINYQHDMKEYLKLDSETVVEYLRFDKIIEHNELPRFLIKHEDRVDFSEEVEKFCDYFQFRFCYENDLKESELDEYLDLHDINYDFDLTSAFFEVLTTPGTPLNNLIERVGDRYADMISGEDRTRVSFSTYKAKGKL